MEIAGKKIGEGSPVYIIAEIGNMHDGSLGQAKALIKTAAECGVDAVKTQTHDGEAETLPDAPFPPWFNPGETRIGYYNRIAFSKEQYEELIRFAQGLGVTLLSSPFSIKSVDLLESVGMQAYKIPSGEVTHLPYIDHIARLKKPVFLSSGMSNWEELDTAVETIRRHHDQIVLMQCTSEYPCSYERVGLNVLKEMRDRYRLPAGLSDHTEACFMPIAAAAMGACAVEKHFTLSKKMFGPDAPFSMEPDELKHMVQGIRAVGTALSHLVSKNDLSSLKQVKQVFEKSIVAAADLPEGLTVTTEHLTCKKPGGGLPPKIFSRLVGRKLRRPVKHNERVKMEDFA